MKTIRIGSCWSCPYVKLDCRCGQVYDQDERELRKVDISGPIPDWCPLGDSEPKEPSP